MPSPYQKFSRDVGIIGVVTVIQFILGILQVPLMTKTLGSYEYGLWTQFSVTASLILPFTNLGLGSGMIRFLAAERDKSQIREQFYSVIFMLSGIHLVVALAIFGLAGPIAGEFFDGATQIVMVVGFFVLLTSISGTYLDLIRAFHQITRYAIFTIAEEFCRFGLVAYLVLTGHGILSVVLAVVLTKVAILSALFFMMKAQIGIKWPRFSRIKEYLRFGLPLVPGGISFWLLSLSDRYIIAYFHGVTSVAVYSVAATLGTMSYSLVGILNLVQMQTLSRLYDEGKMDEVKTVLRYSLKYFLALGIPYLFGAAILAEPLLRVFSNPEIASLGHLVTPVSALSTLFMSIAMMISYNLILTKKTKIMGFTWMGAFVVNFGLNMLMVPLLGIEGAAIASAIVFALSLVVIAYYSFKEFKFGIDWLFIGKSLLASAVMSLVVWKMNPQGYTFTMVTVLVGVVIYMFIIFLLRGFSKAEVALLRGLFKRDTA